MIVLGVGKEEADDSDENYDRLVKISRRFLTRLPVSRGTIEVTYDKLIHRAGRGNRDGKSTGRDLRMARSYSTAEGITSFDRVETGLAPILLRRQSRL